MKFRSMKWTAGLSLVAAIVSVGTALPELSTSLVAAIRGERDIATGNIGCRA